MVERVPCNRHKCGFVMIALCILCFGSVKASGDDWPQWRGPARDGVSSERNLLERWPEGGPRVQWSVSGLGEGYGSVAIQGERILVQGTRGRNSVVVALNRADGHKLWTKDIGPRADQNRGPGPRATPTLDGDRVYVLSENGDLACLLIDDGSIIWRRNILSDFGGKNPTWLISESPLIDRNHVIVSPGGRDAAMVALDKRTGKTVWTSRGFSDGAGYASTLITEIHGVRTILGFTAAAAVGVRATDGQLMWRYQPVANRTANIATPVVEGSRVFFTSAYGTGGALLELTARDGTVRAREIYFTRDMQNHHGGVVLVEGFLYGFSGSILTCVDFETGQARWKDRSVGKGAVTYADGHLYILGENNVVGLVEATPEGYREKGRFSIPDQGWPSWAHPVVHEGALYIRNQGTLTRYDIRSR